MNIETSYADHINISMHSTTPKFKMYEDDMALQARYMMDFEELKHKVCALLEEAHIEYTVSNNQIAHGGSGALSCVFHVSPPPLDMERYGLIAQTQSPIAVKLVQPSVTWTAHGPSPDDGRIFLLTENSSFGYDYRNVDSVFASAVGGWISRYTDSGREHLRLHALLMKDLRETVDYYQPMITGLQQALHNKISQLLETYPGVMNRSDACRHCEQMLGNLNRFF
jgi:hypothetical protein